MEPNDIKHFAVNLPNFYHLAQKELNDTSNKKLIETIEREIESGQKVFGRKKLFDNDGKLKQSLIELFSTSVTLKAFETISYSEFSRF